MALGSGEPAKKPKQESAGEQARNVFSRLQGLPKDKSRSVAFRIQSEQFKKLQRRAKKYGMTPGQYARWCVGQMLEREE